VIDKCNITKLLRYSLSIRLLTIESVYLAQSGHIGGALSIADILSCLYFSEMNISPNNPKWEDRDRLVLSKGHCSAALYAALALRGFFSKDHLKHFRQIDSYLEGHPNMTHVPGVDMSTGSLGQGISAAVGMALACRLDSKKYTVYCILGDGELEEGQVWEALMAASHYKLNNLICFVDNNGLQIDGPITKVLSPEPISDKFKAFGWGVLEIDGHSPNQIINSIRKAKLSQKSPTAIICKTVKGHGVSFMENSASWHGSPPNKEQRDKAIEEINLALSELEDQ